MRGGKVMEGQVMSDERKPERKLGQVRGGKVKEQQNRPVKGGKDPDQVR